MSDLWLAGIVVYIIVGLVLGREAGRTYAWADDVDILGRVHKHPDHLRPQDIFFGFVFFLLSGATWLVWVIPYLIIRAGWWGAAMNLLFAKPLPPKHARDAQMLAERDKRIEELEREVGIR